ncbi:unnamed protein product, partial [Rotaria sp. Silwood1]
MEQEHQLLILGPRFIFDDPKMASRQRTAELATLKRKIEARFFDKKVSPGRPVEQFITELDVLLQKLHNIPIANQHRIIPNQSQIETIPVMRRKKKNYGRLIKRLRFKFKLTD